ncbi:MAG TPA: DUF559 domain-containing protein [Microbacteriaceae bacterium]|nr:DUF559 domain-containing protein [Microbacteriaceae bacterium]
MSDWDIGRARHDGRIIRIRRAWYALPGAHPATCTAVRVGGMLTCVSLLEAADVWTPPHAAVHVSVAANASRLRSAESRFVPYQPSAGILLHWRPEPGATTEPRDTVLGALVETFRCADEREVVAMTDSALRHRLVTRSALRQSGMPDRILSICDGSAESGGETFMRLHLRSMRCQFRTQVSIPGVGRVDFLIGDRLVLEVDGYAFHGDREAFERDRARDLALVGLGYLVIRVSYRQVLDDWPRISRSLAAIIRSRRHLRPRQARRAA